jgi:hypothetical protein
MNVVGYQQQGFPFTHMRHQIQVVNIAVRSSPLVGSSSTNAVGS